MALPSAAITTVLQRNA